MSRRLFLLRGLAACIAAPAIAQPSASEPSSIRLVVPFPEGGRSGFFAKTVAPPLAHRLGRPVVVEHRTGAAMHEIAAFANSEPDGSTLLVATVRMPRRGTLTQDDDNRLLDSLVPVSLLARDPMVLVMNSRRADALGIANTRQLLTYLRANPGRLTFASAVQGSTTDLAIELFKSLTHTYLLALPAPGLTPDAGAVINGRIDLTFATLNTARRSIRLGEWRALGTTCTAQDPNPALDRLYMATPPTPIQSTEPSLASFDVADYCSLLAPLGTPATVARVFQEALAAVLAEGAARTEFLRENALPGGQTLARYLEIEQEEAERWRLARARW